MEDNESQRHFTIWFVYALSYEPFSTEQNVEVNTIDKLCNILDCNVEDIMTHYPDDNVF